MIAAALVVYLLVTFGVGSSLTIDEIIQNPVIEKLARARYTPEQEFMAYGEGVMDELDQTFKAVKA